MIARHIPSLLGLLTMLSIAPATLAKESGKLIASGKIVLDKGLSKKAHGIRTLYLIVYDPASPRPMPYGAQKVELKEDASGTFHTFELTSENLMVMGGGKAPDKLKIKARLDRDGSAGGDATGDIVGIVPEVKLGSKDVVIQLDKAI